MVAPTAGEKQSLPVSRRRYPRDFYSVLRNPVSERNRVSGAHFLQLKTAITQPAPRMPAHTPTLYARNFSIIYILPQPHNFVLCFSKNLSQSTVIFNRKLPNFLPLAAGGEGAGVPGENRQPLTTVETQ
ncbi:hypothetical protein [Kamptonema formosum]|uniref:hypothetical protein n=1 Tax=Kamptonema formosum TaxID=331992 RepID=UPI0012DF2E92|nr:hypothetical protein [Oscillatoria sp. PCC 10802]